VYTVPSATEAVVSTIVVCNRGASAGTYRLAVRPNGATLANQHYLAYDVAVSANDALTITVGITLDAGDVLEAYASSGDMTFQAYGSEIS